jgi:hypothetical protein
MKIPQPNLSAMTVLLLGLFALWVVFTCADAVYEMGIKPHITQE